MNTKNNIHVQINIKRKVKDECKNTNTKINIKEYR